MSENKNRSGLWYLLPIVFGIIGGVSHFQTQEILRLPNGNIVTIDSSRDEVQIYTSTGTFVASFDGWQEDDLV